MSLFKLLRSLLEVQFADLMLLLYSSDFWGTWARPTLFTLLAAILHMLTIPQAISQLFNGFNALGKILHSDHDLHLQHLYLQWSPTIQNSPPTISWVDWESYPYPRKALSHPIGPAIQAKDGRPRISLPQASDIS